LAVLQDAGGAVDIALSFRKVAKLPIPAGPRNLSNWGGSWLMPLLLVALYWYFNTLVSSAYVMWLAPGVSKGL
jgi:hypothetical protein